MNKTILIICDGMDYSFVQKNMDSFPFIKRMSENGSFKSLQSVVPADSVPSWSTIYTGLNPCQHGVLESIDYLNAKDNLTGDYSWLKGNVFWDKIGQSGYKVLVVNPFMAYPSWNVNGLMVSGPCFESGHISISDSGMVGNVKMPNMGGITDYPRHKEMPAFFDKTFKLTEEQFDSFECLMELNDYDFGFLGILTLDRMQHFLWRYTDPSDKTFVRRTKLHDSILDSYKLIDRKLEEIYSKFGDKYNLLVISDHGHGKRCEKTFFINRWLIKNGFMPNKPLKKRLTEYIKNLAFDIFSRLHCIGFMSRLFKNNRFAKKIKSADYGEQKNKTKTIYVPNFDGVNPFGGINVSEEAFDTKDEYRKTVDTIIQKLSELSHKGKKIIEWVKKKEEIYQGDKIDVYPTIIFKLNDNYGVDRGLYGRRLFGRSYFHQVLSGGHRWYGVCLSSTKTELNSVLDVYNYIMEQYK